MPTFAGQRPQGPHNGMQLPVIDPVSVAMTARASLLSRKGPSRCLRVCALLGLAVAFASASASGIQPDDPYDAVIERTEEYVSDLEQLLALYQDTARSAEHVFQQRTELYSSGLISRQDFEANRRNLEQLRNRIEDVRSRIAVSGTLISEARLAQELSKGRAQDQLVKEAVILHTGSALWKLADISLVEGFYVKHFGIPLPVSALGQTELHSRMGFDHHDAVDVALHPDSPEGRELMEFLRTSGISFIAFRAALPGSATGAHIHIGHPSARIAVATIPASTSADRPGS